MYLSEVGATDELSRPLAQTDVYDSGRGAASWLQRVPETRDAPPLLGVCGKPD